MVRDVLVTVTLQAATALAFVQVQMGGLLYVCAKARPVQPGTKSTTHDPARSVFALTPLSIVAVRTPESKQLRVVASVVIRFVVLAEGELLIALASQEP
jgi:hypothetical protein